MPQMFNEIPSPASNRRNHLTRDRNVHLYAEVLTVEAPRPCNQCGNVSAGGTCLAAFREDIGVVPGVYLHDSSWPRRCLYYQPPRIISDYPTPLDYDRRTGFELWPEIAAIVGLELDGQSALGKAVALLIGQLKDGPTNNAADILATAEGANISERTLQRAAEQLGVTKTKAGFSGGWIWAMPNPRKA